MKTFENGTDYAYSEDGKRIVIKGVKKVVEL